MSRRHRLATALSIVLLAPSPAIAGDLCTIDGPDSQDPDAVVIRWNRRADGTLTGLVDVHAASRDDLSYVLNGVARLDGTVQTWSTALHPDATQGWQTFAVALPPLDAQRASWPTAVSLKLVATRDDAPYGSMGIDAKVVRHLDGTNAWFDPEVLTPEERAIASDIDLDEDTVIDGVDPPSLAR